MAQIPWHQMFVPTMSPAEVVIRATLTFFFVLAALRMARRRELSRLATYDLVVVFLVSVALRTSIIGNDVSLTSAFLALGTLFFWNWLLSSLSFRWPILEEVISGKPSQLVRDGQLDQRALRLHRLREDELLIGLRLRHGLDDLKHVKDAFLGADGKIAYVLWDP